ncbi:hypothetical protein O181_036819 [Austropuccinia psidii MF-1]|uniref:Uncharacterized protein n=1 Tax=Austropuccinia psidii MF-1 TaxID=1389203 RepID=A0A9Q3D596_9BASI|nr:hypothetical protein [Austropuccinia psidii MF-1]
MYSFLFLYPFRAFQSRAQDVLTPTARAPLGGTPAVPKLRAPYGRSSTIHPGRKRAKKIKIILRNSWRIHRTFKEHSQRSRGDGDKEEENSVQDEGSDGAEGVPAPVGESQGTGRQTLAQSGQPVSHQSEPSLLAIMKQMT